MTTQSQKIAMTVDELEEYFAGRILPKEDIRINKYSTIMDAQGFVEKSIFILRSNPGNMAYDSARLRLIEFKDWMDEHSII